MTSNCIASVGAYLPLLRLDRKAAAGALRWSGLGGPRSGRRAVAGWDEDAVTLAVEAARSAVPSQAPPNDVVFASTSAPFFERGHAPLIIHALGLAGATRSLDASGSRRAATSALMRALESDRTALVAAGERRPTDPGSAAQLSFGDGGAAVATAPEGAARYLGGASVSHDLVDVYSSREHPAPYVAEERFVRDVTVEDVLAPTIRVTCATAGIEPSAITLVAFAEPAAGSYSALARSIGLTAPNVGSDLAVVAGNLGTAHPIFAFALACERAKAGDIILLIGFGSGCDALLFEVISPMPGAAEAAQMLTRGVAFSDFIRFLSLTGSLDLDWGIRAEFEQKAQAAVLNRYGRDMLGFIGGRDSRGTVQFPKTRMPVDPHATGPELLEDVRLADEPARLVSVTADRLNFTPDPPFQFGLAQFGNGARVMMELTDAGTKGFEVGEPLAMRFRIKSIDRRRGFRTYFWKAAPAERPPVEE
jgi:hydroxymethylglutaryl-CoA synthase